MNAPIARLFVGVLVLFALLVGFTSNWSVIAAEELEAKTANKRPLLEAQQIERGRILSSDGELIAESLPEGKGESLRYVRRYPEGPLFGNPIGYSFFTEGSSGFERFEEDVLTGNENEFVSLLDQIRGRAQEGSDIVTTLDAGAQRLATDLLSQQESPGAVVAIEPGTGAVRVMASTPGFDPNVVPNDLEQLNQDKAAPLVNRSTQSTYPPGSTMKVVTAAAALDSGEFTPDTTLDASSPQEFSGIDLANAGGESFGTIDMRTALTNSVNTYWAQVGEELGPETLLEYMERFGFLKDPEVELPDDQKAPSGVYNSNGSLVDEGFDIARVAIGQGGEEGQLLATPTQMAEVAATVANEGTLMRPTLVQEIKDPDGRTAEELDPEEQGEVMSEESAAQLAEMMTSVAEEGTASSLSVAGSTFAGKTGTAEIDVEASLNQTWFIGFAPVEDPQIAVAVTVERCTGCFGGDTPGPIATAVMQDLLDGVRLRPEEVVDGRYKLVERIGSGGMADVWRAQDPELHRDVAIKVLHENFARDTEFVERFRREASSAAGLQHQNVVSVYDRGEWEGSYYIAMELVEGSSLRDLINRGLEPGEAIEVARQVLAAAQFAHERGIVHRDLKPMNVLIDRDGRIRVTDFGIARAGNSEITQTGSVMGTAQYLSPEQAQGMETGAPADIYSIGVMLFEMLTGKVPFEGENAVAIAMKQVSEPPVAPSTLNPKVSPALDAVVLKALAKDPADRFATAKEMSAALDGAEADPERSPGHTERFLLVEEEEEQSWLRRNRWWVLALLALLLAAGALAYFLTRPDLATVPGTEGKSEAAATIELQRSGFEVDTDRIENQVPEGTVIESDPRGGTEAEVGSTVTITVSLGPGTVEVPAVADLPAAQAQRKLEDAGFEVTVRRRSSEGVKAGRAIGTEPAAGNALEPGSPIDLFISTGEPTARVPSVVGLDRAEATNELEDAGFVVNAESRESDEPEDQVLSQDPAGATSAEVGSEVTIVYSTGVETITLDNFVGQSSSFAERKLANAGLEVSIITQDTEQESQDGIVLDQAPPAGSELEAGDRVTLTVGEFVAPEEPPAEEPPTDQTTP